MAAGRWFSMKYEIVFTNANTNKFYFIPGWHIFGNLENWIFLTKATSPILSYSKGDLDCQQTLAQLQSSKQSPISGDDGDDGHGDDGHGDDGDNGHGDDGDVVRMIMVMVMMVMVMMILI